MMPYKTFLLLDPKDITRVVGEITSKELCKDLHIQHKSLTSWLSRHDKWRGLVIVEKEFDDD